MPGLNDVDEIRRYVAILQIQHLDVVELISNGNDPKDIELLVRFVYLIQLSLSLSLSLCVCVCVVLCSNARGVDVCELTSMIVVCALSSVFCSLHTGRSVAVTHQSHASSSLPLQSTKG